MRPRVGPEAVAEEGKVVFLSWIASRDLSTTPSRVMEWLRSSVAVKATASGGRMSVGDFFSTGRRRAAAEGLAVMETVEADIGKSNRRETLDWDDEWRGK